MKNTWIGDTRATLHMVNSDKGMTEVKIINEHIKMGNGKFMTATKQGMLPCIIKQTNGKDKECKIEVKYIPEIYCNLFSITAAMKKGFSMSSKDMVITMSKGNFSFKFDKMGETVTGGLLIGVEIVPKLATETNLSNQAEPKEVKVDINIAHQWLGHVSESMTRATAKLYGWKLTGKWQICEHCTQAKHWSWIRPTKQSKGRKTLH